MVAGQEAIAWPCPAPPDLPNCLPSQQWDAQHHSFNFDLSKGPIHLEWFKGGQTNITYHCLDRWVASGHGSRCAAMLRLR